MANMDLYEQLQTPPNDALKPIMYGALKGKSDINPQWRYEALTAALGPCGCGWRFEIADTKTQSVSTGETMVFVLVNLYIKHGDEWSAPIPGWGGDYLVKKDKNGIHGNDEAFKMATTDALGTAIASIGCVLNPEAFLFGGGMAAAGELLLEPIRKVYREKVFPPLRETPVLRATLGNEAGITGGVRLVQVSQEK